MNKIILLDWDGPVSNSRTWKMPGCVDPVAIQLLNDLTAKGWKTVLTSTIRKNFRSADPKAEATEFMNKVGFKVNWYSEWRTDPDNVTRRHIEVAVFFQQTEVPEDAVFLVIDDERFPHAFLDSGKMIQIHATPNSGIDYLDIERAYHLMALTDDELKAEYEDE